MREPKEIIINNKTLEQILIDHRHWLNEDCNDWKNMKANLRSADLHGADLRCANLRCVNLRSADLRSADLYCADLRGANLCGANLHDADLYGADLRCADLHGANLYGANLYGANLYGADLRCANLRDANLHDADLYGADLYGADLHGANLHGANLYGANLYGADLRDAVGELIEYRKGKILTDDIIGYKKCKNEIIVTLKIPRGAIMFSINGKKCRTNKAKVVSIDGADRAFSSHNYMSYYVGDEFNVYNFNCEYNVECAEGIHFFMTREDAENYYF